MMTRILTALPSLFISGAALAQASLENPQPNSYQSGIGAFSGWSCASGNIEIAVNGSKLKAASGTSRGDTASVCGRVDTGFGLLFNFNNLGTGSHTAQLFVNGVASGAAVRFNVVAPAGEFLRGANATAIVNNFPSAGKSVTLVWQESTQNFAVQSVGASSGSAGSGGSVSANLPYTSPGGVRLDSVTPSSVSELGYCDLTLRGQNAGSRSSPAIIFFNVIRNGAVTESVGFSGGTVLPGQSFEFTFQYFAKCDSPYALQLDLARSIF